MYSVKTDSYAELLRKCYDIKTPLYVYGGPGIGKSEIPRQVFAELAKTMGTHTRQAEIDALGAKLTGKQKATDKVKGKVFVQWNTLTEVQRKACIANPDDYFVFSDQRVAQMDTTDLRGIPNMVNAEMLETIPMSWVIYFTQKDAHGAIFFDELNLAAPAVAGQAYQIIQEREISDRRIGDDVFVFGAGNRAQDQAHVFTMPFPLRDRFCEFEVTPSVPAWTEYATGRINPHLIAFVNWKESYLYRVDNKGANKSSTPRGIERASRLIGDSEITSNEVHGLVSIAVGEGFATEFQAYCKHFKSLDWKQIYNKPATVTEFDIDKLWAIVGGMGEQFMKMNESIKNKDSVKLFNNMLKVILSMKEDFAVVSLRMFKDFDGKKFGKFLKNSSDFEEIVDRYAMYVIG